MGRSYWFECAKCGYRAKVSGRADRGLHLFVQTILCRDCRELYDAVTQVRMGEERLNHGTARELQPRLPKALARLRPPKRPPNFEAALNRLSFTGALSYKWKQFPLQCPVSSYHRVLSWNEPDKCPRCGLYLERNALPYRIWD